MGSELAIENNAQPLYVQIKESLKQKILQGEYGPYERLPSENNLMKQFSVSRITVRQALRELHGEGLVFSAQGKGTFVSKPKAVQDIHRLEGFGEAMAPKGYDISARLLGIQKRRPPREVRESLELGAQEQVVEVKRIRYLNREPVSVDVSFFPTVIGRKLFGRDLTVDIFPMLENQLNTPLGRADVYLEARGAETEIAALLALNEGDPIMRVRRLTYDAKAKPVDFEYLSFRGDSYQYHFELDRNR